MQAPRSSIFGNLEDDGVWDRANEHVRAILDTPRAKLIDPQLAAHIEARFGLHPPAVGTRPDGAGPQG